MKEKLGIIVGLGIAALVIVTFYIYLVAKETYELFDIITIPIVLMLVLFATYLIWDRLKNIRAGFPVADERLKIAGYKAGHYGFMAAIWSAVGYNMLSIILFDQEPRGGLVVAAVVIVSGIVFALSYLYFSSKGQVE